MKKLFLTLLAILFLTFPMFGGTLTGDTNTNLNTNTNTNLNTTTVVDTNVNTNTNLNTQGQQQGQGQMQGQVQGQDQKQGQNQGQGQGQQQKINFAPVTERDFPTPGNTPLPAPTVLNQIPNKNMYFVKISDVISFQDTYTKEQLKELKGGGFFEKSPVCKAYKINDPAAIVGYEKPSSVKFVEKVDKGKSHFLGFVPLQHRSKIGDSYELVGRAGIEALKMGGNTALVTAEGTEKDSVSSGFGIGTYAVGAHEYGTDTSGVGGGGTGFSHNTATVLEKPWTRVAVYYVEN